MPDPSFTEQDFETSQRNVYASDGYRAWAAEAAALAFTRARDGAGFAAVLDEVAVSRRDFARAARDPAADRYGAARQVDSITHLDLGHAFFIERASRDLTRLLKGPLRYPAEPPYLAVRLTRETHHRTRDGESLAATRLGRYLTAVEIPPYRFESGTLVLEHTAVGNIGPMIADMLDSLERLRDPRCPRPLAGRELARAMHGFYQAMPFVRGSAAIGRSFFAGLAPILLGHKLPAQPPDPDLFAMTALSVDEFVGDTGLQR